MSNVRKNDRPEENRFETRDAALALATHTADILANPKVFDPKYQKTIDEIAYEARMIYHCVRVSNEVPVKGDLKDCQREIKRRLELQLQALDYCEDLRTDIMIAKGLFHLRAGKFRHWNKLLKYSETLIKKWHVSEIKRYSPKG